MNHLDAAFARLNQENAELKQENAELRAERDHMAGGLECWEALHLADYGVADVRRAVPTWSYPQVPRLLPLAPEKIEEIIGDMTGYVYITHPTDWKGADDSDTIRGELDRFAAEALWDDPECRFLNAAILWSWATEYVREAEVDCILEMIDDDKRAQASEQFEARSFERDNDPRNRT